MNARVQATLLATLIGCGSDDAGDDVYCGGQACELASSRDELLGQLEGLGDPAAEYFRSVAGEAGDVGSGYEEIVSGIGAALGCDAEQRSTFVVLSNLALAPKAVVTHCSDDPLAASRVLTIFEPDPNDADVDGEHFRIAAWDEDAGAFRRYQMAVHPEGGIGVVAEPEFCLGCHGGTQSVLGWSPIMNEMTNPWAQWNASPAFESFMFDDPRIQGVDGPTFEALTERLDSASNLEPIIRSGIDRYVASWVGAREAEPQLEAAAKLLRPVFCDETFNYVSEVHRSGELMASAVIDAAIRQQFLAIDPAGWPWEWLFDDSLHISPPAEGEDPMALIAVRGELAVQAETALVSRQVLRPMQVLRVRALDWTHPVGSSLRCDAFEAGLQRAKDGALDAAAFDDVGNVAGALYEEAMAPFAVPDGKDVMAAADELASPTALTLAEWGDAIEVHVAAAQTDDGRAALEAERIRRGCVARRAFPITPLIPGTERCP